MKIAIALALICYFTLLRTAESTGDIIEFGDEVYQVLDEDPDAPFDTDASDDDGASVQRSLGEGKSKLRILDRQEYLIFEAEGESAEFFKKHPPVPDSQQSQGRSRADLPYYHFKLNKNHKGAVYDERRVEIVSSAMINRIHSFITRRRRTSRYPHVMLFPKGGRLGCLRPVLITWGFYDAGYCYRPVCKPTKKTTTKTTMKTTTKTTMKTTTKKTTIRTTPTTTRCVKLRRVCFVKDSTDPGWYAETTPGLNTDCDPTLEDCSAASPAVGDVTETTEFPIESTAAV